MGQRSDEVHDNDAVRPPRRQGTLTAHQDNGHESLPSAIATKSGLPDTQLVITRITVNTRYDWFQASPLYLGHPDLRARMELILAHDWLRMQGHREVIVTATSTYTGESERLSRSPFATVCPHCGGTL